MTNQSNTNKLKQKEEPQRDDNTDVAFKDAGHCSRNTHNLLLGLTIMGIYTLLLLFSTFTPLSPIFSGHISVFQHDFNEQTLRFPFICELWWTVNINRSGACRISHADVVVLVCIC